MLHIRLDHLGYYRTPEESIHLCRRRLLQVPRSIIPRRYRAPLRDKLARHVLDWYVDRKTAALKRACRVFLDLYANFLMTF